MGSRSQLQDDVVFLRSASKLRAVLGWQKTVVGSLLEVRLALLHLWNQSSLKTLFYKGEEEDQFLKDSAQNL